jgi:hypothetical protein
LAAGVAEVISPACSKLAFVSAASCVSFFSGGGLDLLGGSSGSGSSFMGVWTLSFRDFLPLSAALLVERVRFSEAGGSDLPACEGTCTIESFWSTSSECVFARVLRSCASEFARLLALIFLEDLGFFADSVSTTPSLRLLRPCNT